ncbi:hypothetical protein BJ322DRAFT_1106523 [Thelephora terrestris]|uniref:RING-type domain-containing protein n=1 Tax=Thelephora terrestris TaxID=56493 RepID=A0A9P6HK62_9AGAM|nr:hypothetical protein BJ322DRAFT_1106523 [Thelephora terrestris]
MTLAVIPRSSASQCPICSAAVKVKKLSNHVRKNHGNTNSSVEAANQAAPQSPRNGSLAGSLAANSLRVPGEGVYPSTWTSGPVQTHEDSATGSTHNLTLGRFYCQEHDCGRGFSSEAHLESHTRFFHQTKPAQTTAGEEGANPSPKNIPEEAEESVKTSPAHSTSTVGSSESGEYTLHDLLHTPSPAEAPALTLPQEGHQVIPSSAGMSVQGAFGSSATTPGEVSAPPAVTTSSPLSFRCRMCDAPPTVCMRPTATMCGHVFCYECITQHVTSTPRCPVCDGALLLYCLFKLDLPVLP